MERIAKFFVLNILGSFGMLCYYLEKYNLRLMRKIAAHYGASIKVHRPQ